jgi:trans-aconitate 2-methyltransferase
MRPFVAEMSDAEAGRYVATYETLLAKHYPARANGHVHFPFKRVFFVLTRQA